MLCYYSHDSCGPPYQGHCNDILTTKDKTVLYFNLYFWIIKWKSPYHFEWTKRYTDLCAIVRLNICLRQVFILTRCTWSQSWVSGNKNLYILSTFCLIIFSCSLQNIKSSNPTHQQAKYAPRRQQKQGVCNRLYTTILSIDNIWLHGMCNIYFDRLIRLVRRQEWKSFADLKADKV